MGGRFLVLLVALIAVCACKPKEQPFHPALVAPADADHERFTNHWEDHGVASLRYEVERSENAVEFTTRRMKKLKYTETEAGSWKVGPGGFRVWEGTWQTADSDRVKCTYVDRPQNENLLVGCELLSASTLESIEGSMDLKEKLGESVEVTGTAENAKGGAVIVVDDSPIYLEGLDSWPDELHGTELTVRGTLVRKQYIPEPSPGPLYSAGARGQQYVIENPSWD